MKVLIKFQSKVETVDNVGVDDRCLPTMAGSRPYSSTEMDTSPLILESALWFKTLAVEVIYIDVDQKLISWTPVFNEVHADDVVLRNSVWTNSLVGDFIPVSSKPLFKDRNVYDFDASLKEMMSICFEAVQKLRKKSLSLDDFQQMVAKILHVYILPSITFTLDDLKCLTRAQSLIKFRVNKVEEQIASKANSVDILRKCLNNWMSTILEQEDFVNERYLRTCKPDFLVYFLKKIESDVDTLNIELTTEQEKVNWAKEHATEQQNLTELQHRRDELYQQVDRLIQVREAIKNVSHRRDLRKAKVKKSVVVHSCFHAVFVELVRRLQLEEQLLAQLGADKVLICAAREAAACTVQELVSDTRNSDRTTKFDPEDFADFSVGEGEKRDKSDLWLTFQERMAKILENGTAKPFLLHKNGCRSLTSKINLTLSEFDLTKRKTHATPRQCKPLQQVGSTNSYSNVSTEFPRNRHAILLGGCSERNLPVKTELKTLDAADCSNSLFMQREQTALSANYISSNFHEDHFLCEFSTNCREAKLQKNLSDPSICEMASDDETFSSVLYDFENPNQAKSGLSLQQGVMTEQLALSALINSMDVLKGQVQTHFREMLMSLDIELHQGVAGQTGNQERMELLWKSYERFFCQEVLADLSRLYRTALTTGTLKAFARLHQVTLQDILKEDKLLDLFFGNRESSCRSIPINGNADTHSNQKFSMSRTLSSLSLDVRNCDIQELYSLANADGNNLCNHFKLDDLDDEEDNMTNSSCESAKFGNMSDGEDMLESDTAQSLLSSDCSADYSDNGDSNVQLRRLHVLSDPEQVEHILGPVMAPFRQLVQKCVDANCFLDKVRYITNAIEGLNDNISRRLGPNFLSACDDILSMLVLALCSLSQDQFLGLYVNYRLLVDIWPAFLNGTLWDYNLSSLGASYDYLFTLQLCQQVVRQYPGSFRSRRS